MKTLHLSMLLGAMLCSASAVQALNVRTLALAGEESIPKRFVKVDEAYVPLGFSAVQPSPLVKALATDALLPLFELKQDAAGHSTYALAEKVKLPAGAKGVLLLAWGDPKATRYLAVDDDYLSARFNDWLLVNATPKDIAFQIGRKDKPLNLKANSVSNHKLVADENVGLDVIAQAVWDSKVKTFYSTYWPVRSGERAIIVFFDRGERIAVKRITDVLMKPEAVAEQGQPVASPPPVQAAR